MSKIEQVIGDCKITITVERLTEPKAEPKQKEPIKLYCVESYEAGTWLTKGKIYKLTPSPCGNSILSERYVMTYDSGYTDDTFHYGMKIRNQTIVGNYLFPLVKRPAKVGEWMLVTEDATGRAGEFIGKLVKATADATFFGILACNNSATVYISNNEYLVLDGYKGDPEAERKEAEIAKLKAQKTEIEAKIKELTVL